METFYNGYPSFDDENNLSCVTFLKCNGRGVLFPGDLERAGWLELLKQEDFKQALRDTQVLVASHHGRENGCCEEIFQYCSPFYVVISDKGYMYDTQKTIPFYRGKVRGGPFRGETRHVLTTRRDGRIGFNFEPGTWAPY
jgi:beta-lactamase superfamily II metal-dependent hydrolase